MGSPNTDSHARECGMDLGNGRGPIVAVTGPDSGVSGCQTRRVKWALFAVRCCVLNPLAPGSSPGWPTTLQALIAFAAIRYALLVRDSNQRVYSAPLGPAYCAVQSCSSADLGPLRLARRGAQGQGVGHRVQARLDLSMSRARVGCSVSWHLDGVRKQGAVHAIHRS